MSPRTAQLIQQLQGLNRETFQGDDIGRRALLATVQALSAELETPAEFAQRLIWQQPSFLLALKFAADTNLFKHIGNVGASPRKVEDLAQCISVQPELLLRILRHLAASHLLREHDGSTNNEGLVLYGPTHISQALAMAQAEGALGPTFIRYYHDFLDVPAYLAEIGYKEPSNNRDGVFQRRYGLTGKTMFECFEDPRVKGVAADLNFMMKLLIDDNIGYHEVCDVEQLLHERPIKPNSEHLLVDIGGGVGTNAIAVRQQLDNVGGAVVNQDLEWLIMDAECEGSARGHGVVMQASDFFTPQPIFASRFYVLSLILHDWPDIEARKILKVTAAGMKTGYSTLLISEMVLPEKGCRAEQTGMDLNMMTHLAGKERNKRQWEDLLASVDLRIVKIHQKPGYVRSVLECEL